MTETETIVERHDPPAPTNEFRAFFGDGARTFRLTAPLIVELERVTGAGVGVLCKRLFAGEFTLDDLRHTIRLSLIGGGESPETASALVAAYVDNRPLAEIYPIAVAVLESAWFGSAQDQARTITDADQHAALQAVADAIESEAA